VQEGLTLALGKTEGINVVTKDSQGEPDLAVAAVEQLAKEGAMVIIGPVGAAEAAPAALRAQELGIPMISLSRVEGLTSAGPFIFRNSLTNSAQGKALARYVTEVMGLKAAGILAPDAPSGKEVTDAFWQTLDNSGGEVRAYETYPQDQTTFKYTIKRLIPHAGGVDRAEIARQVGSEANAYRRKKKLAKLMGGGHPVVDFDVLLIPDYFTSVLQIAPSLKVEDVVTDACMHHGKSTGRPVTLLGTAGWDSPELIARGARDVQCAVIVDGFYVDSSREVTKKFVAEFNEQFKHSPTLLQAQAYDTGLIARDLLLNLRPTSRDSFRQGLAGVHGFPGVTGATTFGPDREADKPLFFLTVDRTGFSELDVSISPAGIAAPIKAAQP
jgi:branched-chain amino acid transport system substrate-binding protein